MICVTMTFVDGPGPPGLVRDADGERNVFVFLRLK